MTLKTNLIIKGVDQLTAPVKKMRASVASFIGPGGIGKIVAAAKSARAAMTGMTGSSFAGLSRLAANARKAAGRAGIGAITASAKLAGKALGRITGIAGKGLALGTAGLGFLGGWLTGGVIGLAAEFEQFQIVLENTEGSAAKAKKAMAWVKQFATTTPYEVAEVMEAFVALKAYGLDPTDGSLRSIGNAASGMSKGLMEAVEMLADAQTGEFERLRSFGLRASAAGNKVTLSYVKNGKEMKVTTEKNAIAIKKAITSIFDSKFEGMMDRQSKSIKGLWSNLKDMLANFQLDVAAGGTFDFVKGKLQKLLDKVNELARNGTLASWAKKISAWLEDVGTKAAAFIENTDWAKVAGAVGEVARAVWLLARGLLAVARIAPQAMSSTSGGIVYGAARWLGNLMPGGGAPAARGAPAAAGPARRSGPPLMGPGLRFAPPARQPSLRYSPAVGSRKLGRGQIDVNIRTAPGTRAQVTRLSGGDAFDLSALTRGRVQTG